jgi:hypothetical protein
MNLTEPIEIHGNVPGLATWHISSNGIFSTKLQIDFGGSTVELKTSAFKDFAEFRLDEEIYTMQKTSLFSSHYNLHKDGLPLADAIKPSVWSGKYIVRFRSAEFYLQPKGIIKQYYRIFYKKSEIGTIKKQSIWNYDTIFHLPESFDPALGIFLFWLAYINWKKNNAAAASSGG